MRNIHKKLFSTTAYLMTDDEPSNNRDEPNVPSLDPNRALGK